ncbi:DeoR/GlpR family DNA-binding transcription regulator [Parafrankia sp. BMG5.11]|uniref:DeoR/GlpR family DNA-binding transcription regulator n=1 Tax=Parafrankia sp. BMG5.11 TaxID=222540 RepID=UPI00103E702D|nr:DeoR/GlpR family DNA-binding transcription regulator [Parafrankia sp. BMG5.11]TCJ39103.1 DeoR/GlpR transcriptional regulator [Parafrankia sp. BMG5.11]
MHAAEREMAIMEALGRTGFVSYRELEAALDASPATIRRDLSRLEREARILRVHGGAKAAEDDGAGDGRVSTLKGTPFEKSLHRNLAEKRAIGKTAARLCSRGEGIIIDGGTTTFQMCDHLAGLGLQVLTNSLHIVNALLPQEGTQILLPSGSIFREQNIILAPSGEASMPNFHASKLFIGAAAVSPKGVFQADAILVASQRRFLDVADEVILLIDSSKLSVSSGAIVCGLDRIDHIIVGGNPPTETLDTLRSAGVRKLTVAA